MPLKKRLAVMQALEIAEVILLPQRLNLPLAAGSIGGG